MDQISFADAEYASNKKLMRREIFLQEMGKFEPPRVSWRLPSLRRWSFYEQIQPIFTRSTPTRCSHGARASQRLPLA
jgi:hypothetical protein